MESNLMESNVRYRSNLMNSRSRSSKRRLSHLRRRLHDIKTKQRERSRSSNNTQLSKNINNENILEREDMNNQNSNNIKSKQDDVIKKNNIEDNNTSNQLNESFSISFNQNNGRNNEDWRKNQSTIPIHPLPNGLFKNLTWTSALEQSKMKSSVESTLDNTVTDATGSFRDSGTPTSSKRMISISSVLEKRRQFKNLVWTPASSQQSNTIPAVELTNRIRIRVPNELVEQVNTIPSVEPILKNISTNATGLVKIEQETSVLEGVNAIPSVEPILKNISTNATGLVKIEQGTSVLEEVNAIPSVEPTLKNTVADSSAPPKKLLETSTSSKQRMSILSDESKKKLRGELITTDKSQLQPGISLKLDLTVNNTDFTRRRGINNTQQTQSQLQTVNNTDFTRRRKKSSDSDPQTLNTQQKSPIIISQISNTQQKSPIIISQTSNTQQKSPIIKISNNQQKSPIIKISNNQQKIPIIKISNNQQKIPIIKITNTKQNQNSNSSKLSSKQESGKIPFIQKQIKSRIEKKIHKLEHLLEQEISEGGFDPCVKEEIDDDEIVGKDVPPPLEPTNIAREDEGDAHIPDYIDSDDEMEKDPVPVTREEKIRGLKLHLARCRNKIQSIQEKYEQTK